MTGLGTARGASALACAAAFFGGGFVAPPAWAENHAAACTRADVISPLGNAPLRVVYEGGPTGVMKLSGAFGEFTLAGSLTRKKTEIGEGVFIDAVGAVNSVMPDLTKLQSCIKAELAGNAAPDSDARPSARDACLSRPGFAAAPAQVTATVRFGIFPSDRPGEKDAIIEIVRRYTADSTLFVESFPADCRTARP